MLKSCLVGNIYRCYFSHDQSNDCVMATIIFHGDEGSVYSDKLPRTVIRAEHPSHLDIGIYTAAMFSLQNVSLTWLSFLTMLLVRAFQKSSTVFGDFNFSEGTPVLFTVSI